MSADFVQGALFADTDGPSMVDVNLADRELRLCSLNIGSPNPARARRLVDWLARTGSNALVLTEVQAGDGGQIINAGLRACGYDVNASAGWRDHRFHTVIATRGFRVSAVQPAGFDPRIAAFDLASGAGAVRLVGVYGPTNGMTAESSIVRRAFQSRLLAHLADINAPRLCLAGDLNVVEPDHQPSLPAFEPHDYDFYRGLLSLGLRDAYRTRYPCGTDHSWYSPRYGAQRLDHTFVNDVGRLDQCVYDQSSRHEKLTDHAAMIVTVALAPSM